MKIKRVHIEGHPVLGDLDLDFCDSKGSAVDTVIIAGENGVGKSTVMGLLYGLISANAENPFGEVDVEFEDALQPMTLSYEFEQTGFSSMAYVVDEATKNRVWAGSDSFRTLHPMEAIYSDVDINLRADSLKT